VPPRDVGPPLATPLPPTFLTYLVVLCFQMRCTKTKYSCSLNFKMFRPLKNFGLATLLQRSTFLWLLSQHGAFCMWCRTVSQAGILFGRGQSRDARSTVPSIYFRTIKIDTKRKRKILVSLFRVRSWSLRHHSGCATGAERIKRFGNVYLHCIVSNLKKISNMSTLPPLKKFLPTPMLAGHFEMAAFSE